MGTRCWRTALVVAAIGAMGAQLGCGRKKVTPQIRVVGDGDAGQSEGDAVPRECLEDCVGSGLQCEPNSGACVECLDASHCQLDAELVADCAEPACTASFSCSYLVINQQGDCRSENIELGECENGYCVDPNCEPSCVDKECGDNGCFGDCGPCNADTETCVAFVCLLQDGQSCTAGDECASGRCYRDWDEVGLYCAAPDSCVDEDGGVVVQHAHRTQECDGTGGYKTCDADDTDWITGPACSADVCGAACNDGATRPTDEKYCLDSSSCSRIEGCDTTTCEWSDAAAEDNCSNCPEGCDAASGVCDGPCDPSCPAGYCGDDSCDGTCPCAGNEDCVGTSCLLKDGEECGVPADCANNRCTLDWDGDGEFCAAVGSCVDEDGASVVQHANGTQECDGTGGFKTCAGSIGAWSVAPECSTTVCGATCDEGATQTTSTKYCSGSQSCTQINGCSSACEWSDAAAADDCENCPAGCQASSGECNCDPSCPNDWCGDNGCGTNCTCATNKECVGTTCLLRNGEACTGPAQCASNRCTYDWDGDGRFCAAADSCVDDDGGTVYQRADDFEECDGTNSHKTCDGSDGTWNDSGLLCSTACNGVVCEDEDFQTHGYYCEDDLTRCLDRDTCDTGTCDWQQDDQCTECGTGTNPYCVSGSCVECRDDGDCIDYWYCISSACENPDISEAVCEARAGNQYFTDWREGDNPQLGNCCGNDEDFIGTSIEYPHRAVNCDQNASTTCVNSSNWSCCDSDEDCVGLNGVCIPDGDRDPSIPRRQCISSSWYWCDSADEVCESRGGRRCHTADGATYQWLDLPNAAAQGAYQVQERNCFDDDWTGSAWSGCTNVANYACCGSADHCPDNNGNCHAEGYLSTTRHDWVCEAGTWYECDTNSHNATAGTWTCNSGEWSS